MAKGGTIRIKFLNGDGALHEKIKQYGALWLQYAHLTFQYVLPSDEADVKIGFDMDDKRLAWSTIGTDCQYVPQNKPSSNFLWLDDEDETGIKAEALRVYGHILGLGFEHINPTSPLQLKDPIQFATGYNLTGDDIVALIQLYDTAQTNYTQYDKNSVMILPIPQAILKNPRDRTNRNSKLSANDTVFIKETYPLKPIIVRTDTILTITTFCDSIHFSYRATEDIEVNWGDGTKGINDTTHFYSGPQTEHTITFYGSNIALEDFYIGYPNTITSFRCK